jgi:hypothetical protein
MFEVLIVIAWAELWAPRGSFLKRWSTTTALGTHVFLVQNWPPVCFPDSLEDLWLYPPSEGSQVCAQEWVTWTASCSHDKQHEGSESHSKTVTCAPLPSPQLNLHKPHSLWACFLPCRGHPIWLNIFPDAKALPSLQLGHRFCSLRQQIQSDFCVLLDGFL